MDEIRTINTVEELKKELVKELGMQANSFVRTGYLLKMARDTDILKDSGYADIYDFAMKEFGLDSSYVSRYIHINDRFSEGGYSERLRAEYEGYGYSKLSIMLTLPDELNAELSPEYSKSEIETIKKEYDAEQKISDMEVMMEDASGVPDEFIMAVVHELNDENPDTARYFNDTMKLAEKMGLKASEVDIKEAYTPEGQMTYIIRIPGQGRFMVSMKTEGITITNVRDPQEKSLLTWPEFMQAVFKDMENRDFPEVANEKTAEKKETKQEKKPEKRKAEKVKPAKVKKEEPEKEEVAPVQQEKKDETEKEDTPVEKNMEPAPVEKVDGEVVFNETALIDRLHQLIYRDERPQSVYELDKYKDYRYQLDGISEWNAEISNVINKLYAALHDRGV